MINRRTLLLLGALGVGAGLAAYSLRDRRRGVPSPVPASSPEPSFDPGGEITLGFIYVGDPADSGYNQSHAEAARKLDQLPWVRVVEAAHVPEDDTVESVMRRMIVEEGAQFIIPTSYGYFDPYLLRFAPEHPEVHFLHTGGLALPGHPRNISSSYGYIDEAMYLCGIVAAHVADGGKLGFIGAMPIPVVRRNINAFTLGARRVDANAEVHVRFTGNWYAPEAERAYTEELSADGVQALACHVDSPQTIMQACESLGTAAIGYHLDQSQHAPTQLLTGAEWRWYGMYHEYLRRRLREDAWPTMYRGGLHDGMVTLSPFAERVPDAARRQVAALMEAAQQEQFQIYEGPIFSNTGEFLVPRGSVRRQDDPWLETTDWFVHGVIAPS